MEDIPVARQYSLAASILEKELNHGLTPAEAVDLIAVEKADRSNKDWATDVRGVSESAVSGNVSQAREKINTTRLDAEVFSEDGKVIVVVEDHDGDQHDLPFSKETNVVGQGHATLELVYEAHSAVHGFYEGDEGGEFEATLWYDDRPSNSFEDFDHFGEWGSPRAKADAILWERPTTE